MAGFWTGVIVGAAGLWIIQFGAKKLLGNMAKSAGGELGVYGKMPGGKEFKQSYHVRTSNRYYNPDRLLLE